MNRFTMTHEINCNVETFWKTFFDATFNEKLYLEGLKFPEFKILDQKETDAQIVRKAAGKPKLNMPGPIMKILGDSFRYTEDGTFDKATKVWRWTMTPSSMADKLKQSGSLRLEAVGDTKVRRVAELTIEAKIFGLGGLMESSGEKQLREGWDDSAVFMNRWLTQNK
jgi:hypothetical protein